MQVRLPGPREHSLAPGIDHGQRQNSDEKNYFYKVLTGETGVIVGKCHGKKKKHVHIKGKKDERIEIVDNAEADPGLADRLHAAFDELAVFSRALAGVGTGAEQFDDDDGAESKTKPAQEKEGYVEDISLDCSIHIELRKRNNQTI